MNHFCCNILLQKRYVFNSSFYVQVISDLASGQIGANAATLVVQGHTHDPEHARSPILAIPFVKEKLVKVENVTLFTAQVCMFASWYR